MRVAEAFFVRKLVAFVAYLCTLPAGQVRENRHRMADSLGLRGLFRSTLLLAKQVLNSTEANQP